MADQPLVYVGIDDTDTLDTAGTNQLARLLVQRLAGKLRCVSIVRHQLLVDPRVPYTSHNGSASIRLAPLGPVDASWLIDELRHGMQEAYVHGSDPGLCVTRQVPDEVVRYARRCQTELIDQREPRELAARHGIFLVGLGGTEGGVIGALAAVGLVTTGDDGRVVQVGTWPDDLTGPCSIDALAERGIEVRLLATGEPVTSGLVDVGKHCRPNLRGGRFVLFVEPAEAALSVEWQAVRLH